MRLTNTLIPIIFLLLEINGHIFLQTVIPYSKAIVYDQRPYQKIVGGQNTTIERLPYQASLRYYEMHICGAVIISEQTVLTGAHCLDSDNFYNPYTIRVGSTHRDTGGKSLKVIQIIKHPDFNATTYYFDIAIVKLDDRLQFSRSIQPVKLPKAQELLIPGELAIVSGWGALQWKGQYPDKLQYVEVPILDQVNCAKIYATINPIPCHMFCAGSLLGDIDSCSGDSGGPLVRNNTLIGIVSWGIQCAVPGYPGAYTYVSKLRCWIDKNI